MGVVLSTFSEPTLPPSVVLVPPLLERERKGRSRFAKSSYDRLFSKPQLRMLFGDYLLDDVRGILHFSPPEDSRVSVTAKLAVPREPQDESDVTGGSMTLRFQPTSTDFTFFDIKAKTRGTQTSAVVRGCMFDPRSNVAVFAALPLVATAAGGGGGAAAADQLRMGFKYTSPALSAGLICNPGNSILHSAWAVGKAGGLVWGMQTAPNLPLDPVLRGFADRQVLNQAVQECQLASSFAVAYQPDVESAYGGRFTAAVEVERQRQLNISFLHHMAVQRNVHNPFEESDVVGITNFFDVGFQMSADLSGAEPASLRLGASWQMNKNVMIKGRVGLDGASAAMVFRSWWQPAFTLAAATNYDFKSAAPRIGLWLSVETYRNLRYERSSEAQKLSGARVTQRHVASPSDLDYHEGKGLLVPLDEVDNPQVLGQQQPTGADYL